MTSMKNWLRLALSLACVLPAACANAQTGRFEFPALGFYDHGRYVTEAPTPDATCTSYALIWGWNRNGYSAQTIQQLPGQWKCQRYYNGALEPTWYTSILGHCQTSKATPLYLLSGRYVSHPQWDVSTGVCYCSPGTSFNYAIQWCEPGVVSYTIALKGDSKTRALPAGPALPQTATVTQSNGAPASGRSVTIQVAGRGSFSGVTDAQGEFRFTYIPPHFKPVVDELTGTCGGCGTHTALGQPKSWAWNSGDTASRTFDADGRMTSNEFASYGWDAASRITSITQSLWAQKTVTAVVNGKPQTVTQAYQAPITWAAGYDARNRLTSFARTGAGTSYSYDANSNRVSATETSSSELDLEAAFDAPNFTESTSQGLDIDAASNKLLGFTQTLTRTQGGTPVGSATSRVSYSVDANGAMTSDGLRTFEYDESRRLSKVKILKDGEAAAVDYLHNALGQRVFKSQVLAEQILPDEKRLGRGFIDWLREGFGWLFKQSRPHKATLGLSFAYDEDANLIGEYDNGSAQGLGSTEYIWLPVDGSNAIPVGIYRNGKLYQVHSDHLGTPRLVTDNTNAPVWQWPYSAFGNNRTTGVLSATTTSSGQMTLRATKAPVAVNLRFPGQYWDEESNLSYNYFRSYLPSQGRYTQFDPIGLHGGSNGFLYADAGPLTRVDPTGQIAFALPFMAPLIEGAAYLATAAAAAWTANELTKPAAGEKDRPDSCPPGGKCQPCKTVSGKTVAVGTISYRPLDVIPDNVTQHGVYGSHHNIFVANQMPYPKCDCFWAKQKWVAKPDQIQPSWIPIESFTN